MTQSSDRAQPSAADNVNNWVVCPGCGFAWHRQHVVYVFGQCRYCETDLSKVTRIQECGSQAELLSIYIGAIDTFQRLIESAPDTLEAKSANIRLSKLCHHLAAAWGRERRSETIELLEYALAAIEDNDIKVLLADKLTDEAAGIINDAQEQAQDGGDLSEQAVRELLDRMQHALGLLERAAELGSERARGQLELGREVVDRVVRWLRLSHRARRLMQRAERAEQAENVDQAIAALSEMVELLEEELPEDSQEHLAAVLCKRGVVRVRAVIATLKDARDRLEREIAGLVTSEKAKAHFESGMLAGLDHLADEIEFCSSCHIPMIAGSWSLGLPGPGTYKVCGRCKNRFEAMMRAANRLGPNGRWLARMGYHDIARARELDPANEHAKEQLEQARLFLSQCKVRIPRPRSRKPIWELWVASWCALTRKMLGRSTN